MIEEELVFMAVKLEGGSNCVINDPRKRGNKSMNYSFELNERYFELYLFIEDYFVIMF